LPAMLAEARAQTSHGFGLPRFIEREFEHYLACGALRSDDQRRHRGPIV
jgi:hypothetical protein